MDGNKDDAEKCIELATRYIQEGNREKAEKLLLKSERLYPTARAKDLLNRLRLKPDDENLRKKSFSAPKKEEPAFKTTENKENIEVNKDHLDAVKRIKKCKDYYEMLGVSKEATDSEIKKAYKKLALQLHPDKNKSPGAVEAFKALGNAAGVLTNPEKRKQYDLYGANEDRANSNGRGGEHMFHYSRGFEGDVTAEELFNMFFGGGLGSAQFNSNMHVRRNRMYRATAENTNTHHREPQNSGVLLQLVPVLLLIGLSMMSSIFVSDPIYSMNQSTKFPIPRKTFNLKIPYYVKENFANEYQGSLRRLELGVEEEYVNTLRHACYKEKSYRDSMMYKARTFSDRELMAKAQSMNLPSCDALNQLHQGAQ